MSLSAKNIELVMLILDANADVNKKATRQRSHLIMAVATKNRKFLEVLIDAGVNPNLAE